MWFWWDTYLSGYIHVNIFMGYLCKVDLSNAKFDHEIIIAHDSTKTNNFDSFLQFLRFTLTPGILQRMSFYECVKYFLWADFFLRSIFGVQRKNCITKRSMLLRKNTDANFIIKWILKNIKRSNVSPLKMHEMNETTPKHTKNQSKITFLDEINGCAQIRRVFQREMISIRLIRERGSKARVNELWFFIFGTMVFA